MSNAESRTACCYQTCSTNASAIINLIDQRSNFDNLSLEILSCFVFYHKNLNEDIFLLSVPPGSCFEK